jgi:hypothetical protein
MPCSAAAALATVYRGFDVNPHHSLAADASYVARFRQEARLIASLRHPLD